MISVLMECRDQEQKLAISLAALVPGAVEGLIREVIVMDRGSRDGSRKVAEAAGCRIVGDIDAREAINRARSDWIFLLEPGARPLSGWIDRFADHMAASTAPARLVPAHDHRPRLFARLRRLDPPLRYGLLMTRGQAAAQARPGQPLSALGRGLAMRRLACEIIPAQP